MKSEKLSIVLILIFYSFTPAQNEMEYFNVPVDSSHRYQGIIAPLEFQYNFSDFYGKQLFHSVQNEVLFMDDPSTILMRTELALSYSYSKGEKSEMDDHFAAPLYQKH